jgi:hypothetical protein
MCRFVVCSVIEVLVGILDVVYRSFMAKEKLKELLKAQYTPPLTEQESVEASYALLGFFETLLEIEKENEQLDR